MHGKFALDNSRLSTSLEQCIGGSRKDLTIDDNIFVSKNNFTFQKSQTLTLAHFYKHRCGRFLAGNSYISSIAAPSHSPRSTKALEFICFSPLSTNFLCFSPLSTNFFEKHLQSYWAQFRFNTSCSQIKLLLQFFQSKYSCKNVE